MEITETRSEGLLREFNIKVEAAELDRRLVARLEELKGQVQLKGFRRGKAPVSFLKKLYGKGVMGEIIQDVLSETSQKTLSERELKPAGTPQIEPAGDIENVAQGGADLEYNMSVELLPDFEPVDVSTLKFDRLMSPVSDEELDEALGKLAEQQKSYEPREDDAVAEDGDALTVDFVGKIDGEPFEGGAGEGVRLVLGSGSFIPGFEEQLVGVKAGEDRVVKVTFPEDYSAEHLKGKDAEFEVGVSEVAAPQEASLDDELAKKLGLDDLDALKDAVTKQIESEHGQYTRMHLKRALLDSLSDAHDFELPPKMVDAEFDQIWQQVEQAGPDEEDEGKSEDELKADYRKIAERRVRLGLVLAEIGKRGKVDVPQEDLSRAMAQQASQFPGQEQQVFEFYRKNPGALAQLRAPLFEERVVDYILELAEVNDVEVPLEDLKKEPDVDLDG